MRKVMSVILTLSMAWAFGLNPLLANPQNQNKVRFIIHVEDFIGEDGRPVLIYEDGEAKEQALVWLKPVELDSKHNYNRRMGEYLEAINEEFANILERLNHSAEAVGADITRDDVENIFREFGYEQVMLVKDDPLHPSIFFDNIIANPPGDPSYGRDGRREVAGTAITVASAGLFGGGAYGLMLLIYPPAAAVVATISAVVGLISGAVGATHYLEERPNNAWKEKNVNLARKAGELYDRIQSIIDNAALVELEGGDETYELP